jgi:hypothetical protein
MGTLGLRQECRPILVDTSNITNLYAHVVERLSPRNWSSLAVIVTIASEAAWCAMSSSLGPSDPQVPAASTHLAARDPQEHVVQPDPGRVLLRLGAVERA